MKSQMKLSIFAQSTNIGVLPYTALLSGSASLGDVQNSWITFVNKALLALPTHPLAILNKSIPTIITTASTLADSFKLEVTSSVTEHDGIVNFKGVDYYVTNYETNDPSRIQVTLECVQKKFVDAQEAAASDESVLQLDTLDLLFGFVTGQLASALNQAALTKDLLSRPIQSSPIHPTLPTPVVNVAAPAQPAPLVTAGVAAPALPSTPAVAAWPQGGSKAPVLSDKDAIAAQLALSNLLRKGHL